MGIIRSCSKIPHNSILWNVQQQTTETLDVAQTETDGLEVLETREWVDSLDYVLSRGGPNRAGRLLQQLALHARTAAGRNPPLPPTPPYPNHTAPPPQPPLPPSP